MPRLPFLRTRRRAALTIGGGVVVVAVAALAFVYFVLFPSSSPKPLTLTNAKVVAPVRAGASLAGRWTIATGSVAGYRVREKLGFLPAPSDAVGRTSQISGTATLTQADKVVTIAASAFRVAVNTLKSNEAMRDQHIQTIGLQSATYPTAIFSQSTPLRLPAAALDGRVVRTSVTGLLTLHGTARAVTIPLQVRLSATRLQAAGSITFPWGEFHMTAPSVGGFVSVTAHATMEFDLQLTRTG